MMSLKDYSRQSMIKEEICNVSKTIFIQGETKSELLFFLKLLHYRSIMDMLLVFYCISSL